MSSSKKRSRFFDAVLTLDSQDAVAEKHRQAASKKDIQRSQAAQSQTKVYSSLVECRILLQRSMTTAAATATTTNDTSSEHSTKKKQRRDDSLSSSSTAVEQCNTLLEHLLQARHKLTNVNHNHKQQSSPPVFPNYQKLLSLSNDNNNDDDFDDNGPLEKQLQLEFDDCRERWKTVLNHRHKDVRLHTGMATAKKTTFLKVLDSSFWEQVESTVQHEELRQKQQQQQLSNNDEQQQALVVFDDAKVYQHLLKDFVATATSQLGQQDQLAQQRLLRKTSSKNSSKKKDVDRRASKGRKIRYTEITKLANFTFPVSRNVSGSGAAALDEDEWLRSLFGGAGAIL